MQHSMQDYNVKTERGKARVENYNGKPEEFGLAKRTRRLRAQGELAYATRVRLNCPRCHLTPEECKYPISHSHPTINTIELPAQIRAIGDKAPAQYTARDIRVLNDFRV